MFNLIRRATDICSKFKIDPNTLTSVSDIYDFFKGEPLLYGTVLKYHNEKTNVICIVLTGGWYKQYICNGKPDVVRIIRDLQHHSFKQKQIADILGISPSQVSTLSRAKNIANHEEEDV